MSVLTEWFEGRQVDEELERAYWGRIATEIACAVCLGIILAGCASVSPSPRSEPRQEVCLMQLLGHTDGAVPVVATTCVSPEEFAAAQK